MTKYVINRLIRGLISVAVMVIIVMVMIFTLMDRQLIFAADPVFSKQVHNSRTTYQYRKWEEYGYLDYVTFADYLLQQTRSGVIDEETRAKAVTLGRTPEQDSDLTAQYVAEFTDYYRSRGYEVTRMDTVMNGRKVANGGQAVLFAAKDKPIWNRAVRYFTSIFVFDNIHRVEEDVGERKLTFTLYDPVYGGKKFSPAIMGNGTLHRYLLYCDNRFPYIHQNFLTINLGKSFVVNQGVDVFETMTRSQGAYIPSTITYPTGLTEVSADDLHTATYVAGSLKAGELLFGSRYTDDYTQTVTVKGGRSKMGYSFIFGIFAVALAYLLGLPLGVLMALKADKLIDKIGTFYIIFVTAVPSLSYIFMVKTLGYAMGIPTSFDLESSNKMMYLLPIISLAIPSVARLMRWMRRYMIDQRNSDYVKFARSNGLGEGEIFTKHIMRNAVVPIVQGIPASILFSLVGAFYTERVYAIPGTGGLMVTAIQTYDNNVIVGVCLFYGLLSVVSLILGDVLMAAVDPRISFNTKAR